MSTTKPLVLLDIDDVLFKTQEYIDSEHTSFMLYEDAITVLDHLAKIAEIGVLSQGDTEHQYAKLKNTGIFERFQKTAMHIVANKDESLEHVLDVYKHHRNIYYVDDRLQGLYYAKKFLPGIITVWLKRGRHKNTQAPIDGFQPDYTIDEFTQFIPIVTNDSQ